MSLIPKKARQRWQVAPWQQTLAIVVFVLFCAAMLAWSGLDQAGIQVPN